MRRIIVFIIVAILIIFALTKVFSKGKAKTSATKRRTTSDTLAVRTKAKKGKTAGAIKAKTKEEIALEKKQARVAERARKRELRRQKRAEARARRLAGRTAYSTGRARRGRRGTRSTRIGRKGSVQLYQLRAIFTVENASYALIDDRQFAKSDDIMGRKIIDILNDRIIIDEFGRTREVKIGESVLPNLITPKRTR